MTDQVNEAVAWMVGNPDGTVNPIGAIYHRKEICQQHIDSYDGKLTASIIPLYTHPSRGVVDVDAILALVAGPHKYHHKMDERAEREANAFNRCRDLTIQNIKALFALQAAALPAAPVAMAIDPQLAAFYQVATVAELLAAQEEHIQKLQDSARRNVKPWEDTFPPTLLPKYLRDSGLTPTRNNMEQVRHEAFNLADTVIEWIESGNVQAARDAIRDSLVAHAALPAVPDGWVLVPKRPTPEMIEAIAKACASGSVWPDDFGQRAQLIRRTDAEHAYTAMLTATPAHDQPEGGVDHG